MLTQISILDWATIWLRSLLGLAIAGLVLGCLLGAVGFVVLAVVVAGGAA